MAKFRLENGFHGWVPSQAILASTLLEGEININDQLVFADNIKASIVNVETHEISQDLKKMILTVSDSGEIVWHKHYGEVLFVRVGS